MNPDLSRTAAASLIEAVDLQKTYRVARSFRPTDVTVAVDGVSLLIKPGEIVGLVGESGSGKSTVGRLLMGLESPDAGCVRFQGQEVSTRNSRAARGIKKEMQIIFQDPKASLNPHFRIGDIIGEPLVIHNPGLGRKEIARQVEDIMQIVGLPSSFTRRHPHELSGGQQQRVAIARALILRPRFIVADEPVTSLDVSIRAQIINLLQDLQQAFGLAMLFISHDLSVVRHLCSRLMVMYKGRIVESAPTESLFARPAHPYTRALLSAIPVPDPDIERARKSVQFDPAQDMPAGRLTLSEIHTDHFVALPVQQITAMQSPTSRLVLPTQASTP